MKSCWAAQLGNCSGKITGEHIVSRGLIDSDSVEVFGFPWLNGEKKALPKDALTRNILCKKHNGELSNIDASAIEVFNSIRKLYPSSVSQLNLHKDSRTIESFNIDGLLLERWFLKTLINIMYQGHYPIGDPKNKAGFSSDELVEIAFGRKGFRAPSGLYVIYQAMRLYPFGRIEFVPIIKNDHSYIAGGVFSFGGPRFLLFLDIDQPPKDLKGIKLGDVDLSDSKLFYHPEKMDVNYEGHLFQQVNIKW